MNIKHQKLLRVAVILLGGIILSTLIITLKPVPEPLPPQVEAPHPADVIKVNLITDTVAVKSQGTVKPKLDIDVTAQVGGQILSVSDNFAVGGFFHKDAVLLQIDPRDYQIELAKAEARLADMRKNLATEKGQVLQAKREWRELGNAEANALFLRKPQLASAHAAVKAAEAEVLQAQLNLERTAITLPFSGRVSGTEVNLGQYIKSGAVIGRVFSPEIMEVRLPLTAHETRLLNIKVDANAIKPLPATLSLEVAGSTFQWKGLVVRTEPLADEKSRLFYVIAEVKQALEYSDMTHPPLAPGTFIEAEISSSPYTNITVLPRQALFQRDKVLILDSQHHLSTTTVKVLQVTNERLVVSGLQEGDIVLVKPPGFIEIGVEYEPVFVNEETSLHE